MGSPCRPGVGRELQRQDELLAWHSLKLWPRSPTNHYDVSHPQHPRDPQCNCQHLLSHSVLAVAGFDEDRRRRRRERNKVAATKCRNKKKEKTTILVAESEIVEVQNASLKAEVARLDAEKRRLTTILAQHQPNCVKKRRLCTEEVPAPLVRVKSNTATEATVQTDPSARRRRRTTWRTRDTSPSRRKPKTTSTPVARCTVMCII